MRASESESEGASEGESKSVSEDEGDSHSSPTEGRFALSDDQRVSERAANGWGTTGRARQQVPGRRGRSTLRVLQVSSEELSEWRGELDAVLHSHSRHSKGEPMPGTAGSAGAQSRETHGDRSTHGDSACLSFSLWGDAVTVTEAVLALTAIGEHRRALGAFWAAMGVAGEADGMERKAATDGADLESGDGIEYVVSDKSSAFTTTVASSWADAKPIPARWKEGREAGSWGAAAGSTAGQARHRRDDACAGATAGTAVSSVGPEAAADSGQEARGVIGRKDLTNGANTVGGAGAGAGGPFLASSSRGGGRSVRALCAPEWALGSAAIAACKQHGDWQQAERVWACLLQQR